MRGFVAITVGAVLLITAAAGFIIVPEHPPSVTYADPGHPAVDCSGGPPIPAVPGGPVIGRSGVWSPGCRTVHHFPSHTVYDALRIATWAALILGVLVAAMGLIQTARARADVTADRR